MILKYKLSQMSSMNFFPKLMITTLTALFLFSSFTGLKSTYKADEIIGFWVYKTYKNGAHVYTKKSDFNPNKPGYNFDNNGKMVKRMDPDWCARVKGPYTNLEGSYKLLDKNTIETTFKCPISTESTISKYKIIELSNKKLIIKPLPKK